MLRPENPGGIIVADGDIDNRLKTLLDALSVPPENQIKGISPQSDEDPFYCLLEDDILVTGLNVATERLLKPDPKPYFVNLMITAILYQTRLTNLHFL